MKRLLALCLTLLLVVAGVTPAVAVGDGNTNLQADTRPDPDSDVVGWEAGYWHDDPIDVDQSDGLSDEELDAYVARSMARVEQLRNREFKEAVPVSVISREEYQKRSQNQSKANASFEAWNNQVWEALFITGEKKNVQKELGGTLGSSVAGFYSPKDDEIKIVTDSTDSPTIDNGTLHHELVHALQDQYYDLSGETYTGETQDGDLAISGAVEGEANYIEDLYLEKCDTEWECVETPRASGGGGGGAGDFNLGILLTVFQPYSDGPPYVHELRQEGGWKAVDDRMRNPPVSTEQVIHRTDEKPVPIEFTDRSSDEWSLFDEGVDGSDTVGEASLYAMFYYQDRQNGVKGFDWREVGRTSGAYDTYNYDSEPTNGWANDRVFPYKKGTGNATEYGYVWMLEWDTKQDATQFHDSYVSMLNAHDATKQGGGVYVVEEGDFADAFRVTKQGTRVTIVNAPEASDLSDVRPAAQPDESTTKTSSPGFTPVTILAALTIALASLLALAVTRRTGR